MVAREFSSPSLMEEERPALVVTDNAVKEEAEDYWLMALQSMEEDDRLYGDISSSDYSDSDSDYGNPERFGLRPMTELEKARYERQIEDSKGFDIESMEKVTYSRMKPVRPEALTSIPAYQDMAEQTVRLLNQKGESFELVQIVKATEEHDYCWTITYFTLLLRDVAAGSTLKYRAKVIIKGLGKFMVELLFSEEVPSDDGTSKDDEYVIQASRKRPFGAIAEAGD